MFKTQDTDERRMDTTNNAKEPCCALNLIQPHGAMIVIKEPDLTILQVSANTRTHFGFTPEELVNQPLARLLGEARVERLRGRFLSKSLKDAPQYLPAAHIGNEGKEFELQLHRRQEVLILECERKPDGAGIKLDPCPSVNGAIARMRRAGNAQELCQIAADETRRFTGFDRVIVYRFNEDRAGEVIVESLGGNFSPYLGLRYPASHIPAQTRLICLKRWSRMIVDVNGQSVPLVPPLIPLTNGRFELSYAATQSISPAHAEYLKNIGVTASLFISIAKNNHLWGMVVCHHHSGPAYVSHETRMACECLAHFLSLQMAANEEADNNEHLTRINAELERSNIELDSFAYIASHDLKEPLRGIHNYSHFLIEDYADKLDEEGLEKLRTLIKLSERMEALVDSLLNFSRAGQAEIAMRQVDLDEVVSKTLEMITPRLQESGVEIRRPRPLPHILADHARVSEIFHNLIVNAIKYNDKPLKWVEIGWEERAGAAESGRVKEWESGREITLSPSLPFSSSPTLPLSHSPTLPPSPSPVFYVRDNGIGIPEEHYGTIFDIFRRLHGRDEFGGGAGAGLAIVKKIVERHNGRIWVESRVGEGATVYFTLY